MLVDVERELDELERRRAELDRAIGRLRRIAASLRHPNEAPDGAAPRAPSGPPSLTNYCRAVLRASAPQRLTPREVRHLLAQSGFDTDQYANPMAAIHTVLKRLVQQQEAVAFMDQDGERRYTARVTRTVVLTAHEMKDEAFLMKLVEADSPEAIASLIRARRR